jgi:glycosylphosphatidylinositol deacylase
VTVPVNSDNLLSDIQLPSVLSNALVVYRVGATYAPDQECNSTYNWIGFTPMFAAHAIQRRLLPPLLEHTSPSEAHFYPLTHARPLLLHTHTGAPFTSHPHTHGLNLTLHASPDCKVASLHLRVDWWGSLGRAGARYWTAVPGWAVGIVVLMLFGALGEYERGGTTTVVISFHHAVLTHIASSDA